MTKKWNRGKNLDLWKELDRLCLNRNITWEKIEGHSGIPENEFVNALAQFQSGVLSKEPKIENQTPWQEIYRTNVGQLADGGCLELATAYKRIAKYLPRDNH